MCNILINKLKNIYITNKIIILGNLFSNANFTKIIYNSKLMTYLFNGNLILILKNMCNVLI